MNDRVNWKKNLFFMWLSQFLGMVGWAICMPFIPLFLRDVVQVDESIRGVCVSVYTLAGALSFAFSTVFWGALGDRFGRKIMLLRANFIAALVFPFYAFCTSLPLLFAIRFFTSFFSGTAPAAQALIMTTTPASKQGTALGFFSTAVWSGQMAGFLVGGSVVHCWGFTAAFLSCGLLYLAAGLLVLFFVKEDFHRLEAVHVRGETRGKIRKLLTPGVTALLLMFLLTGSARNIETPFLAMLVELTDDSGRAAFFTGIASAAAALGGIFSGVIVGRLCDRYPPEKLLVPLLVPSAGFVFAESFSCGVWLLVGARFSAYMFAGGLSAVLQIMLSRITERKDRGTCVGMTESANQIGSVLAAVFSGLVVWWFGVRGVFCTAGLLFLLLAAISGRTRNLMRAEIIKE